MSVHFKYLLIKVDDFGLHQNFESFRRLLEIARSYNVPLSVGVIGRGLKYLNKSEVLYYKSYVEAGLLELWNHSYNHGKVPLLSKKDRILELSLTQYAIKEVFDYQSKIFGAPFNYYSQELLDDISSIEEINSVYCVPKSIEVANDIYSVDFDLMFTGELYVDQYSRQFEARRAQKNLQAVISKKGPGVLQIHPWSWNEESFRQFAQFVQYVLNQSIRICVLEDYVAIENEEIPQKCSFDRYDSPAVKAYIGNVIGLREVLPKLALNEIKYRLDPYFSVAYSAGVEKQISSIKKLAFDKPIGKDISADDESVLDIGAGVGEWALAYHIVRPKANIIAFDILQSNGYCLDEIIKATNTKKTISAQVLDINSADVSIVKNKSISKCWVSDAFQYMGLESVFDRLNHWMHTDGQVYISTRTNLHYIDSVVENARGGAIELAIEILNILLDNSLYELGFGPRPNVTIYRSDNLLFGALACGFSVIAGNISVSPDIQGCNGVSFLNETVFERNGSRYLKAVESLCAQAVNKSVLAQKLLDSGCCEKLLHLIEQGLVDDKIDKENDFRIRALLKIGGVNCLIGAGFEAESIEGACAGKLAKAFIMLDLRKYEQILKMIDYPDGDDLLFIKLYVKFLMGKMTAHDLAEFSEVGAADPRFAYIKSLSALREGNVESAISFLEKINIL